MKTAGFVVRKFRPASLEQAFLDDYARRFAAQRRLGAALGIVIFPAFIAVDWYWWLLRMDEPHVFVIAVAIRLLATAGIAAATVKLFGRGAYDERTAVRFLSGGTLCCCLGILLLMVTSPADLALRGHFPGLLVALFVFFTLFRLRAIVAGWLGGVIVAIFFLTQLYLYLIGHFDSETLRFNCIVASILLSLEYLAGIAACLQLENAARRDFMFRRSLRASKARADIASYTLRRQNERMKEILEEKERFFSAAYHDVQQPLAAISLFIRSAKIKLAKGEEARHDLDVIQETARDIQDMFKDIQDYNELGSYIPRLVPVDTHALITEVGEQYLELARQRGIQLRLAVRLRRPPPIQSDRSLIKRMLSNFISNAIKNTWSGGVAVGWAQIGDRLRIDVWDTGVGISPKHWNAIFTEYYQVDNPGRDRSKGLGLGLSIVRRVMNILPRHSMRFNSIEGRGSRFSIYAPISELSLDVPVDERSGDMHSSALEGKYILLCDDEPTVLAGLRSLFANAGALVDAAESMSEIETILTEDGRVPDVAVLDIRLSDGSTGIEVAERVRRHFAWSGVVPIAFVTGELFSPRALGGFSQPFELLRKSSAPETILHAVSHLMTAHQRPDVSDVPGTRL
ncbi:response regulator [Caballeronia novacaledonica]|uniref:ATP-binding response regulator n=1 Tax=Caballeronia novacaledonica TaxID=1544861 RepID=UPI001EE2DD18|nr:hybrid sensor histidine kinase/response regulator [Caballeronia novacaledonica]GJH13635.1 response regulator [Caballeronia novacaledonica]